MESPNLCFYLGDIKHDVVKYAKQSNMSISSWVRKAIEEKLKEAIESEREIKPIKE